MPEEIRQKKIALNAVESRVHNFIEFVAQGRATKGLGDALEDEFIAMVEVGGESEPPFFR